MALAVVVGFAWLSREPRAQWLTEHLLYLVVWGVVGGMVGARAGFVLLAWPSFVGQGAEIFNLQAGGLSIHGAVVGAALMLWWYCRRHRLATLRVFDTLVPALVLGQIIGRFGNFFNQEAFGPPTDLPWKMFVASPWRPVGLSEFEFFHPTFLYSALGLVVVLLIVLAVRRASPYAGAAFLAYVVSYSGLRFAIEWLRVDSVVWGALTIAQWASIALAILAGVIGLVLSRRRRV